MLSSQPQNSPVPRYMPGVFQIPTPPMLFQLPINMNIPYNKLLEFIDGYFRVVYQCGESMDERSGVEFLKLSVAYINALIHHMTVVEDSNKVSNNNQSNVSPPPLTP